MDLVTAVGIVALAVGLMAGAALVTRVPRRWRERCWAHRYGDPDERRVGDGLWWGHVSKLAGVTATNVTVARWVVVDGTHVLVPEAIIASLGIAIIFGVTVLVAQLR